MGRFFTPKTKGSARRIDLAPIAAKALAEWKLASKAKELEKGHSSPTVILNVNVHLMKGENQEAACRLENTIFQVTGLNLVTNEKEGQAANG